jgi:integral membrane protein (TIGR01906 family)
MDFYSDRFDENNIYDRFDEDIDKEFGKVLDYLLLGGEIDGDFFNSKEKEHLMDVRGLYIISWVLIIVSLIVLIVGYFRLRKKEFLDSLGKGGIATLVFILLLSLSNFNNSFIKFHQIFFSNNLWLLNPETDNLIVLLPTEIFEGIVKRSLLLSGVGGILLFFIGLSKKVLSFKFRD